MKLILPLILSYLAIVMFSFNLGRDHAKHSPLSRKTKSLFGQAYSWAHDPRSGYDGEADEVEALALSVLNILCQRNKDKNLALCAAVCAYNRHFITDDDTESGAFGVGKGVCKEALLDNVELKKDLEP